METYVVGLSLLKHLLWINIDHNFDKLNRIVQDDCQLGLTRSLSNEIYSSSQGNTVPWIELFLLMGCLSWLLWHSLCYHDHGQVPFSSLTRPPRSSSKHLWISMQVSWCSHSFLDWNPWLLSLGPCHLWLGLQCLWLLRWRATHPWHAYTKRETCSYYLLPLKMLISYLTSLLEDLVLSSFT